MTTQESKQVAQADLESGSASIGFVEYGIPYYTGVFDFCIQSKISAIEMTISIVSHFEQDIKLSANNLTCSTVRPLKVILSKLNTPMVISCTIVNTCGGNVQRFQKGETIVANAVIRNTNGDLFNPGNGVTVEVRKESGEIVQPATAAQLISTGTYSIDIQTTAFSAGEYIIIFKAVDGTRIAIDWDRFRIEEVPGL